MILEDFYQNRDVRIYKEYAPTIRAERLGLLVMEVEDKNKTGNKTRLDRDGEWWCCRSELSNQQI